MRSVKKLAVAVIGLLVLNLLFEIGLNESIKRARNSKIVWILKQENKHYTNLFIGASKIDMGIDPAIFDAAAPGTRTVNFGYHGFSFIDIDILLDHFLAHNRADNVFIEVEPITVMSFDFTKYNAYYNSYMPFIPAPDLKKIVKNDKLWYSWKYLPFYRYIDFKDEIDNILKFSTVNYDAASGYTPRSMQAYDSHLIAEGLTMSTGAGLSKTQLKCLSKIINAVKGKSRIYFIRMPTHRHFEAVLQGNQVYKLAKNAIDSITLKYGIPYINGNSMMLNRTDSLFRDDFHLNAKGAGQFSALLSHQLNNPKR